MEGGQRRARDDQRDDDGLNDPAERLQPQALLEHGAELQGQHRRV